MSTAKFLLYTALGVAAVLLLTSDKAKEVRDDLEDKAKDRAKQWKEKWSKVASDTNGMVSDLKHA